MPTCDQSAAWPRGPSYAISRSSAGFLHEVCSGGAAALCKINQEHVIRYIERHAQDWSPGTGKAMCWSLRAFLRYLHHRGLNARPLADCVPSMRRWKLATLPTYLPAAQVRKALDGCDRKTVMGRRDYAILLLLAKLGLRGRRGRDAHAR
jgi:integrase